MIVGCDRVAANGDVANKVGTYGLALAARAAGIPFVVAGPTSTIDFDTPTGAEIAIEERDADEVRFAGGRSALTMPDTGCRNPAFDVTPAPGHGAGDRAGRRVAGRRDVRRSAALRLARRRLGDAA